MKRGRLDIIIEVLETAKVGVNKTRIVYRANLNFRQADKYLALLQKHGLMENKLDKYIITEKGKEFLDRAQDLFLHYSLLCEQLETQNEIGSQLCKIRQNALGECSFSL